MARKRTPEQIENMQIGRVTEKRIQTRFDKIKSLEKKLEKEKELLMIDQERFLLRSEKEKTKSNKTTKSKKQHKILVHYKDQDLDAIKKSYIYDIENNTFNFYVIKPTTRNYSRSSKLISPETIHRDNGPSIVDFKNANYKWIINGNSKTRMVEEWLKKNNIKYDPFNLINAFYNEEDLLRFQKTWVDPFCENLRVKS